MSDSIDISVYQNLSFVIDKYTDNNCTSVWWSDAGSVFNYTLYSTKNKVHELHNLDGLKLIEVAYLLEDKLKLDRLAGII